MNTSAALRNSPMSLVRHASPRVSSLRLPPTIDAGILRMKTRDLYHGALGQTVKERMTAGKALRESVPRTLHAQWVCPIDRPDPVELLKYADGGRLPELLPIRYGRMRQSPFAFFRGAGALMARDLAATPTTGIRVQACGDCHVRNFGGFGSPERRLVFDINDFDETLNAPWEWDVKRLATSIVLKGRQIGVRERSCEDAVRAAVESYRQHMRGYGRMRALEVWYAQLDAEIFIEKAKTATAKKHWARVEDKAKTQTAEHVFPRITDVVKGQPRIIDSPPVIYHPRQLIKLGKQVREMFRRYRLTLPEERRANRHGAADAAVGQRRVSWVDPRRPGTRLLFPAAERQEDGYRFRGHVQAGLDRIHRALRMGAGAGARSDGRSGFDR